MSDDRGECTEIVTDEEDDHDDVWSLARALCWEVMCSGPGDRTLDVEVLDANHKKTIAWRVTVERVKP